MLRNLVPMLLLILIKRKNITNMYAERLILETDPAGNIKYLPKLPANKQFETIFLVLKNVNKSVKRSPHPEIVGKIKIIGDIFDTVPSSEWNFSL